MARSGLGVPCQGPWASAVSVSQGTMRPRASPTVGPHPRLSQQPRRSAAEHGWRTRSHERREDLGGSQLLTPLPLPRLCSAPVAPGVASPKLAAPQKGPFPLISPPLLQGRAELPMSCSSRDPGPTSTPRAGDAPPVPIPALAPTWAPRLRLPSERLMLCTGASPFPGTVLAVVPLAYRTDPALPQKRMFVCLQPREQARDLRGGAAALPPASRHRANYSPSQASPRASRGTYNFQSEG